MKAVLTSRRLIARFYSTIDLPTASMQHDGDMLKKLSLPNASNDTGSQKDDDDNSKKLYSLKFKKELDKTKFTIFRPIADCGYYGWNPMDRKCHSLVKLKSAKEILRHINIGENPKEILPLSQLKLPCSFDMSISPKFYPNKYPFGQFEVASLYVASKYRKVDLNTIDFVFGGSILGMLAKRNTSNKPYMVCRVPTTNLNNTFLVRNCNQYTKNSADIGYQFERYVTTGSMSDNDSNVFLDHMQVMEVGTKFRVLLSAEADAIDDGTDPIEIKTKKKSNWGTDVLFQMISSGSPTVCIGSKNKDNVLTNIEMRSLSTVAADALRKRNSETLERNIVDGMQSLYDQMKDVKDNESYEISFNSNGELSLRHVKTRNAVMLPPENVVKNLLDL